MAFAGPALFPGLGVSATSASPQAPLPFGDTFLSFLQPPVSPSGPRSPPRTVPAACTVGELPLAAPTPPSVGAVSPAPLVSLSQSRTPGCKEMHPHRRGEGLREGKTRAELGPVPVGPEDQRGTSNSESGKGQGRQQPWEVRRGEEVCGEGLGGRPDLVCGSLSHRSGLRVGWAGRLGMRPARRQRVENFPPKQRCGCTPHRGGEHTGAFGRMAALLPAVGEEGVPLRSLLTNSHWKEVLVFLPVCG